MQPDDIRNSIFKDFEEIAPNVFHHYHTLLSNEDRTANGIFDRENTVRLSPTLTGYTGSEIQNFHENDGITISSPPESLSTFQFSGEFLNEISEVSANELKILVPSGLSWGQWDDLQDTIMISASVLDVSPNSATTALTITDNYLRMQGHESIVDYKAVCAASLYIATKINSDKTLSLFSISKFYDRSPEVIKQMEKTLRWELGLELTFVAARAIISRIDHHILGLLFPTQRPMRESMKRLFLLEAQSDSNLSSLRPSSVAFGYLLTVIAALDPRCEKGLKLINVLRLAENLNLWLEEILKCVDAFVRSANNSLHRSENVFTNEMMQK